jgi:hypothetical protein
MAPKVINPYAEILAMKPKISEVEIFLPYLNDTSFIPTFWYWRDFRHIRKLYRVNMVIADLIFNITQHDFFGSDDYNDGFDEISKLTLIERNNLIEVIRTWCKEHSGQ